VYSQREKQPTTKNTRRSVLLTPPHPALGVSWVPVPLSLRSKPPFVACKEALSSTLLIAPELNTPHLEMPGKYAPLHKQTSGPHCSTPPLALFSHTAVAALLSTWKSAAMHKQELGPAGAGRHTLAGSIAPQALAQGTH
jgi:hypothetical protein